MESNETKKVQQAVLLLADDLQAKHIRYDHRLKALEQEFAHSVSLLGQQLLTAEAAALELSLSEASVRDAMKAGYLPFYSFENNQIRIRRSDLNKYREHRRVQDRCPKKCASDEVFEIFEDIPF